MENKFRLGIFSTSRIEIIDIIKAWVAISIAFGIVMGGVSFTTSFLSRILLAAITVGIGFLLHELSHKVVAQHYGCFAEFRAFDSMLLLAIAFSFIGLIFATPGAVMIAGQVTRRENGLIAAAGPWMNIALALVFLAFKVSIPAFNLIWSYGFAINSWLALFNMIPIWIFDGEKIMAWDMRVWGATAAVAAVLVFVF